MKKIYHISLSSHEEVLFRNDRDFAIGFNCLAEAAFVTDSKLLADGLMSTHWHSIVLTDDPQGFVHRKRYAYACFFNAMYGRTGRLAERKAFITELDGIHRLTAALNYVNRQGLHHGLSETPFGYPHCSANSYFRTSLGKEFAGTRSMILPPQRHHYLIRNTAIPDSCRMDSKGLLFREDVLDTSYVEQIYMTPRNYIFQMNKLSDERSLEDQKKEKSKSPLITIDVIEEGTPDFDVQRMLQNEQGHINKSMLTDQELCWLIDDFYVPWIKKDPAAFSPYACSLQERSLLYETISRDMYRFRNARTQDRRTLLGQAALCGKTASEAQLRRCLVLPRRHAE